MKWHQMTYGWQIWDKYDHWADRGPGRVNGDTEWVQCEYREKVIILAMQWFNALFLILVSWVQTTGIIMYPGRVLSVFLSHNGFFLHPYNKIILNIRVSLIICWQRMEQFYSATRQGKVFINLCAVVLWSTWTCVVNHKSYFPPHSDTWRAPMCRIWCYDEN